MDDQLAEIAAHLDETYLVDLDARRHVDTRRFPDRVRFSIALPNGARPEPTTDLITLHRRLAGASRPQWTGEAIDELSIEEAESISGDVGPILKLLRAFGLRRARSIWWLLDPPNAHRMIWDRDAPGVWRLERRKGWTPNRPSTIGDADAVPNPGHTTELLAKRPCGMDDDALLTTLPLRCVVRDLLNRGRIDEAEAHQLVTQAADLAQLALAGAVQ